MITEKFYLLTSERSNYKVINARRLKISFVRDKLEETYPTQPVSPKSCGERRLVLTIFAVILVSLKLPNCMLNAIACTIVDS